MKCSTQYVRITRRVFTFDEVDVKNALMKAVKSTPLATAMPDDAKAENWQLEIFASDSEADEKFSATLTQTFEYDDKWKGIE